MRTRGLAFRKFDLHIHTPASDCFYDKSITPQQIVDKCLQLDLSAIAIMDHNTGIWIDDVKSVAKGSGLTVFPGVEVTVGDAHNHIMAILDIDKTTRDIESLLITLGIRHNEFGKKGAFSHKSVSDAIKIITGEDFSGLAILAHIDSTNGVFCQMRGAERIDVIQNNKLLAVEAVDYSEVSHFLDGNDQDYRRKLAIYQSSDNPCLDQDGRSDTSGPHSGMHSIDGIGSRYTYFKVDENINLESLRQCFIDPDVRIRQSDEYQESKCPYIKSVKIYGGFLNNEELVLHCGLNSILGAKGVGKSLLIELIRFALDQKSVNPDIITDHEGKLREKLGQYGKVEIVVYDGSGRDYQIIRTYDPSENNPIECKELSSNELIDIDIAQLFQVLFLSQMEIMRIAENPKEQMDFIDRYFDFRRFQNQINNMELELGELDRIVAESIRIAKEEKDLLSQKQAQKFEIDRISAKLQNPIFEEYAKLESKDRMFRASEDFMKSLVKAVDDFEENIEGRIFPNISDQLLTDLELNKVMSFSKEAKHFLLDNCNNIRVRLADILNQIIEEYKKWKVIFDDTKLKYQDEVAKMGGDFQKLEEQRKIKIKDIENIDRLLGENKTKSVNESIRTRNQKLDDLRKVYNEYFQSRKEKCEFFESSSNGKLEIKIIESINTDEFMNTLTSLKIGSYLRASEIEKICSKISPNEFIHNLILYNLAQIDETEDTSKYIKLIAEETDLPEEKIRGLADHLLNTKDYEELLSLQYKAYPQDKPEIKYNVSNDQSPAFVPLRDLSTGQKCTAMIILALSDGTMPIVIDQPEDSLDIRAIWDDMCCKLRTGKDSRQFVFTTHNSSVAVASDTDKFIIMTANATKGKIIFSGSIDNKRVKQEVIDYLEGGPQTYKLKYAKYDITE